MARIWMIGLSLNIILACAVYYTKYEVIDLSHRYFALQKNYTGLQELKHTLQAEHTLLTNPKRLAGLATKMLGKDYDNPAYHQFATDVKLAHALAPLEKQPPLDNGQENGPIRLASHISYIDN